MDARGILLDGYGRVHDALHRALGDLTVEELHRPPSPPIGWLAWRITRSQDSQVSSLAGREQAWLSDSWHERFGMPPDPADYGPGQVHTREGVAAFRAPDAQTLLDYYDTAYDRTLELLDGVTAEALDRELDEPRYQPRPTVSVRLVSILESNMGNMGQITYLKHLHRVGGWFPMELR